MTIKKLKELVDKAYSNSVNGENEVEVWLSTLDNPILCEIENFGQYEIVPDITISIKPTKEIELYTLKLDEENIKYKEKYIELNSKLNKIINIIGG